MTKFKNTLLALGTVAAFAGPLATAVACGSSSSSRDPQELKTIVMGENTPNSFLYQTGTSYGSGAAGEVNAYVNSYEGKLIRHVATNERVQGVVGDGYGDPTDKEYKQELRLELAEALIVYDHTGTATHAFFNEDELELLKGVAKYAGLTHLGINDDNAQSIIDGTHGGEVGTNQSADFVVRSGQKWANHNGAATDYEIVAKDFYYSMYHTGLMNNAWRNDAFHATNNPFGGHGTQTGTPGKPESGEGANDAEDATGTWALAENLDTEFTGTDFSSPNGGFPNTYLYTMFGLQTPAQLVTGKTATSSGAATDPNILGKFGGEDTVRFLSAGDKDAQLYNGIVKFWADGRTLAPVPSQKIDEDAAAGKYDKTEGLDIYDGVAKDLGYYGYGKTHTDVLYASPYYIAESTTSRFTLEINKHYWDQEWVTADSTVTKYIIDYVNTTDADIFTQSQFADYKIDELYKANYALLNDAAKLEVGADPEKFGVRYAAPFNNASFNQDMLTFMSPAHGQEDADYLVNDHSAKLWFGTDVQTLKDGNQTITDYIGQDQRDFRSQLTAAINWFGFARILHPGGEYEDWLSYMPAEIPLGTADGSDLTPYDYKEEFKTANYTIGGVAHGVTSAENQAHYENNGDDNAVSLQSADFTKIQEAIGALLDGQTIPAGEKVVVPVKERSGSNKDIYEPLYAAYEETLEALDDRIDVQFYDYSTSWPGDLIVQNGLERFGGWGSDYDGVGSMFTGLSSYGTSIQAMAMIVADDTGDLPTKFPELAAYGPEFEAHVDALIAGLSDEAKAVVKPASAMKDFTNEILGTLSGNHGTVTALLPDKDANGDYHGTPAVNNELLAFYGVLDASVATFDLQYFSTKLTDDRAVELISEVRQIMGVSFGVNRSMSNREIPAPVIYRNDLIIPIYFNGQSNILDWKVGQVKAAAFA